MWYRCAVAIMLLCMIVLNCPRTVVGGSIAALNKQVTKNSMKSDQLSMGVSAKYDINKNAGSLFDIRTISIGRMIP